MHIAVLSLQVMAEFVRLVFADSVGERTWVSVSQIQTRNIEGLW